MGDEVPTQSAVVASPATIANNRGLAARFVRAYGKAIELYDRAFQRKGRTASRSRASTTTS